MSQVNSNKDRLENSSPSEFKFPDTIVKDGKVFYRHDADKETTEKGFILSVTPSTNAGTYFSSESEESSLSGEESQMPRAYNILIERVKQAGSISPIISAAVAGASIRGSSKGSTSHVIGSAINGGYFAASAQGYDGKGGAIHSHVRGTAEGVSGGASAIAPDRNGEAFIQVDHSERGLSIGQSSTHNGEAFVIADVDSESKNILQHGDSTSSYENKYDTKIFGHSSGEAKSSISAKIEPIKNDYYGENLDTGINRHNQRSVGIDMIDNIIEKVHLPNTGTVPKHKSESNFKPENNFWSNYPNYQEEYDFTKNFSQESTKNLNIVPTTLKGDLDKKKIQSEAKKKGVVGVVTFPYDQEGLPPGPGELLDQTSQTHSYSPTILGNKKEFHTAFLNGYPNELQGDISKQTYDTNKMPFFSPPVQVGNRSEIYLRQSQGIDSNDFKEYRYPQIEERLLVGNQTGRNDERVIDDYSFYTGLNKAQDESSFYTDTDVPIYSQTQHPDSSQIYFYHGEHNLTTGLSTTEQYDDFDYKDTSIFNRQNISLDINIGHLDKDVHLPPRQNVLVSTSNTSQVSATLIPQINEENTIGSDTFLQRPSKWNEGQQINLTSILQHNFDHAQRNIHGSPPYVTDSTSDGYYKNKVPDGESFLNNYPDIDKQTFSYGTSNTNQSNDTYLDGVFSSGHYLTKDLVPLDISQFAKPKSAPNFSADDRKLYSNVFHPVAKQLPTHEVNLSYVSTSQDMLDDSKTNVNKNTHTLIPGYLSNNDPILTSNFYDQNLVNFSSTIDTPYVRKPDQSIYNQQTHTSVDEKLDDIKPLIGNDTYDEIPHETSVSLPRESSSDKNKIIQTIPVGEIGSTQLLRPAQPGQPFINVVTVARQSLMHPRHKDGIMIGPGENLPGIPGYRIPPGFRGKVIFGDITNSANSRNQNRNSQLNQQQQRSFSRQYINNDPRRRFDQSKSHLDNYKNSKYNRYKHNNYQYSNSDYLANLCKKFSYNCEIMNRSRNKRPFCNPLIVGIACCC